jgi:hypothetical protein
MSKYYMVNYMAWGLLVLTFRESTKLRNPFIMAGVAVAGVIPASFISFGLLPPGYLASIQNWKEEENHLRT